MPPKPFTKSTAEDLLVKCHRHCCICHKFCGSKMEIHHIDQEGSNDEDNGIPLCLDCHAEVLAYNDKHPKGRKYSIDELKRHRDQWFRLTSQSPFGLHNALGSKPTLERDSTKISVTGSTKSSITNEWEDFEDNRVFIFNKEPSKSRKMFKRGYFSPLANIPVFIPSFTNLDADPHIFNSKSVYLTSRPPTVCDFGFFDKTIKKIEEKWKNGDYRRVYDTFNWSISEDEQFTFGYGGTNLISELHKHERASIGAVLKGNFGEDYGKTFFLVIYAYLKGGEIRNFGGDFYLKTVPIQWDWFKKILTDFQDSSRKIDITHYSFKELPIYCWKTGEREVELEIIGGLRRYGFRSRKIKTLKEDDRYSGIIIESDSLLNLHYELETKADDQYLRSFFTKNQNPILNLRELLMDITNPVPTIKELESEKKHNYNPPSITMIPFDAYGAVIYGLAIHSGMGSSKMS